MIHIGLDLHQKNSYVQALTNDGELFPGQRIDHSDPSAFWQYFSQFGDEPKRVVFEATAKAQWMDRLLWQDPTIESVAVTPHKMRIIAETVAKTDKIDATVLADRPIQKYLVIPQRPGGNMFFGCIDKGPHHFRIKLADRAAFQFFQCLIER